MKGKPPKIDLIALYAKSASSDWNVFLASCLAKHDMQNLSNVLYGLQLGMNDLVKKKLNTDKMNLFFLRLQRSIENTMKLIIKEKDPHPLDNAFNHEKFGKHIETKKERDSSFEAYLRKTRF